MKERIFTTKEQGRVLVEAGLPISTAIGFRDKYLDSLHSMEDDAGRIGLIEAVTPDISNPVWDVGTLLNLLPYEIEGSTFECYKLENAWFALYRDIDDIPIYWGKEKHLIDTLFSPGMLQNHKLAGSVYDASFSMFRNQLEYKCRWYGKELIVIDRFYPSSKTCSRCGWKNKDLKLSDRTFVCKDCGMEIDRDLNAAINIQAVGVDAAIRTQSSRVASCVEASKME